MNGALPYPEHTRAKGSRAEEIAARYLESHGYTIVCRNYRKRNGEIDIIARDAATTVFVEVKSALTRGCGHPFSWVTPAKQRTIATIARMYLAERGGRFGPCRFDVIAVTGQGVEHLKNAFLAG